MSSADLEEISSMTRPLTKEQVGSIKKDTARLVTDVPLVAEALQWEIVPTWLPLRSVISILSNPDEIAGVVEAVLPQSTFYHNPERVRALYKCLLHWREKELLDNRDAFANIPEALSRELENDTFLLAADQC
jgi:hypothetical protein